MKLARFLADGLPDTGFGDDRIEISFGSGFRNNVGLAVDGLGRVIFADTEASATPVNLLVGSLCGGPSVDTRVDDFVFADQTGVPRSSVRTSAPITISGLRATVPAILRVEGGTYSIGCGADNTYTDAMEKVVNGQTVCLRHISAGTDGTSVNTTLRVSAGPDEFSDVFTSTTGVPVVPGMLQFSAATFSAAENAGTASVTVTRTGGTQGSVSVTLNGAGAPITVNFANGQASQIVNLPVSDNSTDGPDQTLNLTLNEATGGASLGAQNRSVLTVTDDDAAPTVSFTLTASTAAEGDGTRQIAVQLSAASGFAISVTLEVSGTADGADFSLGSATLNFAPGGTTAQATINLADDSAAESAETIVLRLINPLNASLGSQTSHSVTVAASDTAPPPPPPAAADAPAQASAKSGSALGLPLLGGLLLAFARRRRVLAAAVLLAGSAQAVQAQEAARWYVSGSLGSSQAGNDVSALRQRLAAEGHNVDYQLDDRELGGTFLIGRQVHPRAAIEAGYTRLGHFTASANGTTPDAAALLQTLVHTVPLGGNSVGLGLRYFFGDGALRFEPHVGVLFYQAERAAEVNGLRSSRRVHGLGGSVGLGAGWTFVPDWQATADWTLAVPGSDNTVQSLSLGLRWWM